MLEKLFKAKITKVLLLQGDKLKQAYLKHVKEKKDEDNRISEEDAEKLAYEITVAISYVVEGMQESMIEELKPLWVASGEAGNEFFNLVQFTKPEDGSLFDIIRQDYLDWLDKYGADMVTRVNRTTKDITKRIIRDGLVNGNSTSQIADDLVEQIAQYTKQRAELISLTETHNSFMTGNFMSAKSSGFKYKTYITAGDARVRPRHVVLNNVRIKIDEKFANGGLYPGDSALGPEDNCRCRCSIFFD